MVLAGCILASSMALIDGSALTVALPSCAPRSASSIRPSGKPRRTHLSLVVALARYGEHALDA
jgi:hypothetical protein